MRVSSVAGRGLGCPYQVNPEQLRLEDTSGDHVIQRPAQPHQLQQVAEYHVQLGLNICKDGVSLDNLFQCSITLKVKVFFSYV